MPRLSPHLEAGIRVWPGLDDPGGPGSPLLRQFTCFSDLFHLSKSPLWDPDGFSLQNERPGARWEHVRMGLFSSMSVSKPRPRRARHTLSLKNIPFATMDYFQKLRM